MKRNGEFVEQSKSHGANEVTAQMALLTIRQVADILDIGQTRASAIRPAGTLVMWKRLV